VEEVHLAIRHGVQNVCKIKETSRFHPACTRCESSEAYQNHRNEERCDTCQ